MQGPPVATGAAAGAGGLGGGDCRETMVRSIWGALGSGKNLSSGQSQGLSRDDPATVGNTRQCLDVLGRQSPGVLLASRA